MLRPAIQLSNVGKLSGKWSFMVMLAHEYQWIGIGMIAAGS